MKKYIFNVLRLLMALALPFPANSEQELSFVSVENFAPYAWLKYGT
ncbi:MAG: hypothetical protein H8E36_16735 [Rhodospirillaceae bacterium]|nr:hypothetical protein [Rhodospirillaceae bacterium]MBL6930838.1 hypothetical protein [Rhodospirillales bacterium]MBL6942550.1 hypothetical protein [Rhodospirillales bacterium]